MFKIPIVLFIFNRPDTTQRVLETIRSQKPKTLFVIADGPRSHRPEDSERCNQTRQLIETIDWPCEIIKHYSDTNLGCGIRIVSGLDFVFSQVEKAIIFEDDCVAQPSFFRYCEDL